MHYIHIQLSPSEKPHKYERNINLYTIYHNSLILKNTAVGFFYVGVVYSREYDVCDVTLSVYPHRASLKNMPGHGGNRTYDLWSTYIHRRFAPIYTRT